MDNSEMLTAFFIGLLSALHCFGMCGGIVGALSLSLHPDKRQSDSKLFQYVMAYNTGRLLSYSLAGALVGMLGQTIVVFDPNLIGITFRVFAAIFLIILGLYVGGWIKQLALIEKIGQPIWRRLQPIGKQYLPVKSIKHAFLFGLVWGWLPCGLVYYALVLSLTQGSILNAAGFMLAFGLGTLTPMLLAGMFAGRLLTWQHSQLLRQINAGILIALGCIGMLLIFFPEMVFYK
jgi:sulfite exporter TauE/SafE